MARSVPPAVRTVLPWIAVWASVQAVVAVTARLVARRKNEGDESSTAIRRVQGVGGVELHPTNPKLTRVRVDLVMAGGVLDLSRLPRVPGGIDVTIRAFMGGMAVQVPPGWRVWWQFRGMGGMGADGPVVRTKDEAGADLRLHVVAVMGGVGIESGS
ncbi:hypothetical protein [Blastococcus jejuensis]|uniref:hypothetical protein n=1 Tax=Blastococcus jejuensis TaxID=351224 RepID=UPI0031DEEBC3